MQALSSPKAERVRALHHAFEKEEFDIASGVIRRLDAARLRDGIRAMGLVRRSRNTASTAAADNRAVIRVSLG